MKIYFLDIVFNNKHIVWDLNEETDEATCLQFGFKETFGISPMSFSIEALKIFPNIEINENSAVIRGASQLSTLIKIPRPGLKHQVTNSLFFDNARKSSRSAIISSSPSSPSSPTPPDSPSEARLNLKSILLEALIPRDDPSNSTLWGNTVAYKEHFIELNAQEKITRASRYVRSSEAFVRILQYEKNDNLYPWKFKVITALEELLVLLNPVYVEWSQKHPDYVSGKLIRYFQDAVEKAMLNGDFNARPTEFDSKKEPPKNKELREFGINRIYRARAEMMLIKFLVLVSEEYPVALIENEEKAKGLVPVICTLRQFFFQQDKKTLEIIRTKLEVVMNLIAESGKVEVKNNKLTDQLFEELKTKTRLRQFTSFRSILDPLIAASNKIKPEQLIAMIDSIAKRTMDEINKNFHQLDYSQSVSFLGALHDKDFYIQDALVAALTPLLPSIKVKKEKNIIGFDTTVADIVVTFLKTHIYQNSARVVITPRSYHAIAAPSSSDSIKPTTPKSKESVTDPDAYSASPSM